MLEDRFYMRRPSYQPQRSLAVTLMIANTVIFVLQSILEHYKPELYVTFENIFALSTRGLASGYLWQFLTFQFMHAGLFHLLCNTIVFYFFGRAIEDTLGRNSFLKLYLLSGVIGGVFQIALALLFPTEFGGAAVVGASAGGFGLVAAFALLFPERQITLLLFFVLPISIRARTLLWFALGLALFGIIVPSRVADGAHLGGILTGLAYVHFIVRGSPLPFTFPSFRAPRKRQPELVSTIAPKKGLWQRSSDSADSEEIPPGEFISREVDPILDKISAHGIQSLTDKERKILEDARAKMAKR
ncbi:MAG: rhomboid family intramembrane serine protease [Verrucomicrobia bacterium]|nr:rhomboid family intramembrane serine protease [Verrucomicrobiota bacterium]